MTVAGVELTRMMSYRSTCALRLNSETSERILAEAAWWTWGVIYQIYPRSFQDSNGGGVGDINGIRRRLDYLAWLGVDAIVLPTRKPMW